MGFEFNVDPVLSEYVGSGEVLLPEMKEKICPPDNGFPRLSKKIDSLKTGDKETFWVIICVSNYLYLS